MFGSCFQCWLWSLVHQTRCGYLDAWSDEVVFLQLQVRVSQDVRNGTLWHTVQTPSEALVTPFYTVRTPSEALVTPFHTVRTPSEALVTPIQLNPQVQIPGDEPHSNVEVHVMVCALICGVAFAMSMLLPQIDQGAVQQVPWAALFAVEFMAVASQNMIVQNLPHIVCDFDSSSGVINLALELNWIAAAVFSLTFGKVAVQQPRRQLVLLGLGVFLCSTLVAAMAPNALVFILARIMEGAGQGTIVMIDIVAMDVCKDANVRTKLYASLGMLCGFAAASAPVIGGLVGSLHWRLVFLLLAAGLLGAFVSAKLFLPETCPGKEAPLPEESAETSPQLETKVEAGGFAAFAGECLQSPLPCSYLMLSVGMTATSFNFAANAPYVLQVHHGFGIVPASLITATVPLTFFVSNLVGKCLTLQPATLMNLGALFSILAGTMLLLWASQLANFVALHMLAMIIVNLGIGISLGARRALYGEATSNIEVAMGVTRFCEPCVSAIVAALGELFLSESGLVAFIAYQGLWQIIYYLPWLIFIGFHF